MHAARVAKYYSFYSCDDMLKLKERGTARPAQHGAVSAIAAVDWTCRTDLREFDSDLLWALSVVTTAATEAQPRLERELGDQIG